MSRYPDALVLLSKHFLPDLFRELLEHCHVRWLLQPGTAFVLLDAIVKTPFPSAGSILNLEWSHTGTDGIMKGIKQTEQIVLTRKDASYQAASPLMPLAQCIGLENLVLLFSALACEQRIIFVSKKLDRLSDCIHAALSLISPLEWQHILIPLLPFTLLNYCVAPMPYIVGLHEMYLDELYNLPGMEHETSILLVHLDDARLSHFNDRYNQVGRNSSRRNSHDSDGQDGDEEETEQDDQLTTTVSGAPTTASMIDGMQRFTFPLPKELGFKLRKHLKSKWSDLTEADLFESFQTFWISLFGHLNWSGVTTNAKGKVQCDDILTQTDHLVPYNSSFVRTILHSQVIEQFVTERVLRTSTTTSTKHRSHSSPSEATKTSWTHVERFERVRLEIQQAASAEDVTKPFHALRSFSFVLKRIHAHYEATSASVSHHLMHTLPQPNFGSEGQTRSIPRYTSLVEVRKLLLELTSNSSFSPAGRKLATPKDAYDLLAAWSIIGGKIVCQLIMDVCDERMRDSKKGDHAHGSKALILLENMLKSGSDLIISSSMFDIRIQQRLQHLAYTYTHETERIADGIHTIALRITALLNNVFLMRKTRKYVKIFDLRRFRYIGSGGGMTGALKKLQSSTGKSDVSSVSVSVDIHFGDPEYDEFRHRSLVEMGAPAFPKFDALHAKYRHEFEAPAALPTPSHIRRASYTSPTHAATVTSAANSPHPQQNQSNKSFDTTPLAQPNFDFNFADFDAASGFATMNASVASSSSVSQHSHASPNRPVPISSSGKLRAILPPSPSPSPPNSAHAPNTSPNASAAQQSPGHHPVQHQHYPIVQAQYGAHPHYSHHPQQPQHHTLPHPHQQYPHHHPQHISSSAHIPPHYISPQPYPLHHPYPHPHAHPHPHPHGHPPPRLGHYSSSPAPTVSPSRPGHPPVASAMTASPVRAASSGQAKTPPRQANIIDTSIFAEHRHHNHVKSEAAAPTQATQQTHVHPHHTLPAHVKTVPPPSTPVRSQTMPTPVSPPQQHQLPPQQPQKHQSYTKSVGVSTPDGSPTATDSPWSAFDDAFADATVPLGPEDSRRRKAIAPPQLDPTATISDFFAATATIVGPTSTMTTDEKSEAKEKERKEKKVKKPKKSKE